MIRQSLLLWTATCLFVASRIPAGLAQSCERSQFRCDNGECIELDQRCDGFADCVDVSDETNATCGNNVCRQGDPAVSPSGSISSLTDALSHVDVGLDDSEFRCSYGACIPNQFTCDGITNCRDGSDETEEICRNTRCASHKFQCDYGGCISRFYLCDGRTNCVDSSDETQFACRLKRRRCRRSEFTCEYGACIPETSKCDGKYDCLDRSDETAELCSRPPPTTPASTVPTTRQTPRPTTRPTTLPRPTTRPTPPPPVVFDNALLPPEVCDNPSCRCQDPSKHHICLPCSEIENVEHTCSIIGKSDVCSIRATSGVTINIISCGTRNSGDIAAFERADRRCSSRGKVPVLTVATADCWGVATYISRCHADGSWYPYGQAAGAVGARSMQQLCQPYYLNGEICGRRPRYEPVPGDDPIRIDEWHGNRQNRWPWLAGLKRREKYECSATLINPRMLITAAHCVAKSQETSTEAMDVRELRVELWRNSDLWVTGIYLHPNYIAGPRPQNDLALVQLEEPVPFNKKLYPACVDNTGDPGLYEAVTFNRSNADPRSRWRLFRQTIDLSCFTTDRCDRLLSVSSSQFCGVNLESHEYLRGGSSGGPYLVNNGTDVSEAWKVYGVVSYADYSSSCRVPHTVFTAVVDFWRWIDQCSQFHQLC